MNRSLIALLGAALLVGCSNDADKDGFDADVDCDDDNPAVNGDAVEICDGIDNDCDNEVDEGLRATFYRDLDGDGYGDPTADTLSCSQPADHVVLAGDCADTDPDRHPGAPETDCTDPVDYNCDGSVGFADVDGDGVAACEDCNDGDAEIYAGANEVCDDKDNDCDGDVDEDAVDQVTWYVDGDLDGFGDDDSATTSCEQPPGTTLVGGDCDDGRSGVNPGADEDCDAVDEDCNGLIDDGPNVCPCPIETYEGKAYAFCDDPPTPWLGAQLLCNNYGYDLVSINDELENSFVTDGINTYDAGTDWWIGYTDQASEGTFVWEDGTTGGYENWEPGQPNDFLGQDCAEIDPDGTWNDTSCLFTFQAFVCESP